MWPYSEWKDRGEICGITQRPTVCGPRQEQFKKIRIVNVINVDDIFVLKLDIFLAVTI